MARDWADLLPELLRNIAEILATSAADYIRFRAVCSKWQSSTPRTPSHLPTQLPFLLLPTLPNNPCRFLNLSTSKIHPLPLIWSPILHRLGSSHGYLAFLDPPNGSLSLINPLTNFVVSLPSLSSFPDVVSFNPHSIGREYTVGLRTHSIEEMTRDFLKKIVLSSNPLVNQNYVALAILDLSGKLAWCKNGDKSWKYIEDARYYNEDVIYHKGLFYAVNKDGNIAICDFHMPTPQVSITMTSFVNTVDLQYLATSSHGNLLLIGRHMDEDGNPYYPGVYRTTSFEVCRLDMRGQEWEKVTDLGEEVVFLGENSALAFPSPGISGCRGNSIYYTDDYTEDDYVYRDLDSDSGIYDLGTGSIDKLPWCSGSHCWPPPVWLTPNPFL